MPLTNLGRTCTYEVGHWLGLRHIWGDGDCTVDDFCDGTPVSDEPNYTCAVHTSCGSRDMIQNYMDYTEDQCMSLFTQNQKERMIEVLQNSPWRNSLISN
ncbi:MAG: M43 family zinc metalloprotease [Bacteroidota bacterium]